MNTGKLVRLNRLFSNPSGRLCSVAVDHFIGYVKGLPDGTGHKFGVAWKDHPRKGYIGLQDHGKDCWFKNIKLKPLPD